MILSHRVLLRRFLLLKLVTVLLFPQGAVLPLVAGAMYSLQARSWLRSPHISTKPSNVLLRQLALADSLLLLYGALRLGAAAACVWVDVAGPVKTTETSECQSVCVLLCQWLLDAHHLASLLLLGLLGLEATLVCHWPLQTRALRTSHFAQLGCGLVWALVLMEVLVSQAGSCFVWDTAAGLQVNPRALTQPRQHAALSHSLPTFSVYLRRVLWLTDCWLHYNVLCNKPKRAKTQELLPLEPLHVKKKYAQ